MHKAREQRNRGTVKQPENNQQNGSEDILANNHFKCPWTKCCDKITYSS